MIVNNNGLFMGVDLGTQSVKVGIYDEKGSKIAFCKESLETIYGNDGYAEQKPSDWWSQLIKCVNNLKDVVDFKRIKSISVCATSSTVLLVDSEMNPVTNGILWMDQRNIEQENDINNIDDKLVNEVLKNSGGKVSVEWMISKALWISQNYQIKDKYVIEQLDWINYKLTGYLAASVCNATCKWNYNKKERDINSDYLKRIGLENIKESWPKNFLKVGELVGKLNSNSSDELGLPLRTSVYQGGIDAHIGMIGSGTLDFGALCLITGTSFVHLIHHYEEVFTDGLWGPYDSPILDDHWLIEGGQLSAGSNITWFLREFLTDRNVSQELFEELNEEVQKIDIGSDNLLVLDHWQGNRSPYREPQMRGAIIGLTNSHSKYHIYRAILESIAMGTSNVIDTIRNKNVTIDKIVVGGGLSKNNILMQMLADITNLPIYIPSDSETSTKGAGIIAAYGENKGTLKEMSQYMTKLNLEYEPKLINVSKYEGIYKNYLKLNDILNPFIKEMLSKKEVESFVKSY